MKSIPKIQIAGIKTPEEAQLCVEAGADGLGLLLMLDYPRGDSITTAQARAIVRSVPAMVATVLITHSTVPGDIIASVKETGVSTLQIHNDSWHEMPVADLACIRQALPETSIIKVFHIPREAGPDLAAMLAKARLLLPYVDALILDSQAIEQIAGQNYQTLGGTGCLNDWALARAIVEAVTPCPVIHAGGLSPDNVCQAIVAIRPYGVDVNSGVRQTGSVEKDPQRVRIFVEQAHCGFAALGRL